MDEGRAKMQSEFALKTQMPLLSIKDVLKHAIL